MNELMSVSSGLNARALMLAEAIKGKFTLFTRQDLADLEAEIDDYVSNRLSIQSASESERQQAIKEIEPSRILIQTTKETVPLLDLGDQPLQNGDANLICSELIVPALTGVNYFRKVPIIGYYETKGYHFGIPISLIRLHPAQSENIPEAVRMAIGDAKGKKVDYYSSVQNIAELVKVRQQNKHPLVLNLVSHAWAHPHHEPGSDVTHEVEMGIFCGQNIYPVHSNDGVPFDGLKSLPVTCHPSEGAPLAFSPNNAHFGVSDNQPVSSFWAVFKFDGRTVAIKYILLNTQDNLTDEIRLAFFSEDATVNEVTGKMQKLKNREVEVLLGIADAFEHGKDFAEQLLNALPEYQKNSIYYQTWFDKWQEKDKPAPHGDFGKAAFHCDGSLNSLYHCSNGDRGTIIRNYAIRLGSSLGKVVEETTTLFAPVKEILPRSPEHREKIRLLTPVADAFHREDEEEGFRLFKELESVHQHSIFQVVWEEMSCPRHFQGDFGRAAFFGNDSRLEKAERCNNWERERAVLYYMHSI